MTHIKINNITYPATINGYKPDSSWGNRESKAITLEMTHDDALSLFVDGITWYIIHQGDNYTDPETGETVTPEAEEYDNSEYSVAGTITDNRDGTVTVKMGKPTAEEQLAELKEALENE